MYEINVAELCARPYWKLRWWLSWTQLMALALIFSWISPSHSLAQCPGALAGTCATWKMRDSSCWALITPLGFPFLVAATAFCTGLSYLFGMSGWILLRSSLQGFKVISSPSGGGENHIGAMLPLLMLCNNEALSLRRAAAWLQV